MSIGSRLGRAVTLFRSRQVTSTAGTDPLPERRILLSARSPEVIGGSPSEYRTAGGAAAAVAAGLTPLELGSDIGGSIRNPAHYNGVHGLKPSWGVVPSRGHIPGPPGSLVETDVNCGGPLARSLEDLRTALTVVAGPVPEDAAAWHLHLDPGPEIDTVTSVRVATVFAEGSELLPVA